MLTFNEWIEQTKNIVNARQYGFKVEDILNDKDSMQEAYNAGESPSDYVEDVVDSIQFVSLISKSNTATLFFCIVMVLVAFGFVTYKTL